MSNTTKNTATKKDDTTALVPKLRFPEFRGAEGWKLSVLADACDMQAGKFVSASNILERKHAGLFPCYGGNGLRGYTTSHTHDGTYPLIGRQGALCGNVRLVSGQFHATEHAVVATPKNAIDVCWLHYSLDLLNLNRFATGQAQPGLSVDVLNNVALAIPPLKPEQQKIAECLSSLDELMAAQARKLAALKTHKKGLMQQLFPREGETQPLLRFPEFKNASAWAKKNLRELCERIMDGTHFSPKTKEGPRPYLTSKNIRMGWLDLSTVSYIAEDEHRSIYARCPVKKNDVLLTKDGANTGNCAINTIDDEFSLLSSVAVLRGDSEQVTQQFLYQSIVSDGMQSTIVNSMSGQAITRITLEKLGNYEISVPSVSEQQRIADCLSSLDELITTEAQKIAALKTHKKGLMQQLFPSSQEAEV